MMTAVTMMTAVVTDKALVNGAGRVWSPDWGTRVPDEEAGGRSPRLTGFGALRERQCSEVRAGRAQGTDSRAPGRCAPRASARRGAGGASRSSWRPAPSPRFPARIGPPGRPQSSPGAPRPTGTHPGPPHPEPRAKRLGSRRVGRPPESPYWNGQPAGQTDLPSCRSLGLAGKKLGPIRKTPSPSAKRRDKHPFKQLQTVA
ncbi:uncharacterized protein LOC124234388 [Equus quagga]|uniref:uncharacterized protein LOC124234388 n=1 Tax=Equus quagga TaxID=89248 RepID=UPI001EE1A704|nr:uncharacterized protein LOC124234388 [Equus quagga]